MSPASHRSQKGVSGSPGAAAALLILANLLFFGPATLYYGNYGEFQAPLRHLLAPFALPALGVLVLCWLALRWLPEKHRSGCVAALVAVGALTYVHGNLLVWNYGALDGSDLDLEGAMRGWIDGALWAVGLAAAWRFRERIASVATRLVLVLLLVQVVGLGASAMRAASARGVTSSVEFRAMPPTLAELSPDENVIHLILDAFQADVFEELVEEDPSLREAFDGFTFFRNATTSSAVTYLSVPAALSGLEFTNEEPIADYLARTLSGENLFSVASDQGWRVDVASGAWWNQDSTEIANYYRVPAPYAGRDDYVRSRALLLLDLSLFRHVPHFFKPWVYNNQSWRFSSSGGRDEAQSFEHFAHLAFLEDLTGRFAVGAEQPVLKFIHLISPHAPLVVDERCEFVGGVLDYSRENFKRQSRCALVRVLAFLEALEEAGVYDKSVIVIHGDHGGGISFEMENPDGSKIPSLEGDIRVWGASLPMLVAKPRNSRHPLEISNAQVELTDVPATVADLASWDTSFGGRSLFDVEEHEKRLRSYFWSPLDRTDAFAKGFFDSVREYLIEGDVYKQASWSVGPLRRSSVLENRSTYVWNTRIEFGRDGNSRPYQVSGWGAGLSDAITWAMGPEAVLKIPIERPRGSVVLEAKVKAFLAEGSVESQRVQISVGGRQAGEWFVTKRGFHEQTLVFPAGLIAEDGETELSFRFPDATAPAEVGVSGDDRVLGLAFHAVLLRPVS